MGGRWSTNLGFTNTPRHFRLRKPRLGPVSDEALAPPVSIDVNLVA